MKPNLPLTNMTRQLKEVGETRDETDGVLPSSPVLYTNNGTLTRGHSRRKSNHSSDDSSSTGTLKRYEYCDHLAIISILKYKFIFPDNILINLVVLEKI